MSAIKQYLTRIYILFLLPLFYAPAVWAELPQDTVEGDPGIFTIWVSGDLEPAWRAFKMAALLFGGDGPFIFGVIKVGLLIACLMAAVYIMTAGKLTPLQNLFMVFLFAVLMVPKTTVYIANYMDENGMANAGAVRFKRVDGVPFGVAALLGFFSTLSYYTTMGVDTAAQSVADVNWTGASGFDTGTEAGGLPLYGSQGVFSPLKTLMGLRRTFAQGGNPMLTTNMATAAQDCKTWNKRWGETTNGGYLNVLTKGLQSGETKVWLDSGAGDGKVVQAAMNCADAGKVIAAQSLALSTPKPGKTYSPAAEQLQVGQRNISSGKTMQSGSQATEIQRELNALPSAVASISGASAGSAENPHNILKFAYDRVMANGGHLNPNELARFYSAGVAVDAASIQSALILNRVAQRCIGNSDPSCERAEQIMGEALSAAAVDAAGEASGWQSMFQKFMNFMLSFYVMITPLMIFVVLVRGIKSFVILGTYIVLAAWMNLLLPVQTIAGHFLQYALSDELYNMLSEAVLSQKPLVALSPQFTDRVFEELQKTILTGSTIMSGVSTLALLVLIGSPYVMSRFADRSTMVGQGNIDEKTESPKLDESTVIDAAGIISRSSAGQALERGSQLMSQAEAAFPGKLDLSVSSAVQQQAVSTIDAALSKAESQTLSEMLATTDSSGRVLADGFVLSRGHDGKWTFDYAQKGEQVMSDSDLQSIAATAQGGFVAFGMGAGISGDTTARQSEEIKYVDSTGNSHSLSASTKLDDIRKFETSAGTVDASTLQQARQQAVTDMRSERDSLQTATSSTLSNGAYASIDLDTFRKVGLLDHAGGQIGPDGRYVYGASDQIFAAAKAAGTYNQTVADAVMRAADAPSNVGANLYKELYGYSVNGSDAEKLAATAAFQSLFQTASEHGLAGGKPIADQFESKLNALEYGTRHSTDVQSKIDGRVDASAADRLGSYADPIDKGRLNGAGQNVAGMQGRVNGAESEMTARQQIWEYNNQKIREAAQEVNSIQKQINELENPAKQVGRGVEEVLGSDNTKAALVAAGVAAAPTLNAIRAKTDETEAQQEQTKNQEDIQRLKERKEELIQKINSFDSGNMVQTFDGKAVSEVLGFNPAERFGGAGRMDLRDDAPVQKQSPTASAGTNDASHVGMQKAAEMVKKITGEKFSTAPDKLIHTPDHIAAGRGIGLCANGTALILGKADLIDDRKHGNAQEMGRELQSRYGWSVVASGEVTDRKGTIEGYTPRDGQVALISPYGVGAKDGKGGDEHGHIAVWVQAADGGKGAWVSDYYQGDRMVPNGNYINGGSKITILESPQMKEHFVKLEAKAPETAENTQKASDGFASSIKSLIAKAEGNYHSVNLGQAHGNRSSSRDLSNMTVNEIMAAQRRNEFNAVGKYQMVETTFRDAVKALDLKGNEKFTPALQERIFNDYLLKKAGGGAAWDYIHGKHNDINKALVALAKEWAAFPVPTAMKGHVGQVQAGQSYYHGHNGNKAWLSINQARAALMDARKR